MFERYSIIGLAFGLILILTNIVLLRKRKITGKIFVFWFIVGVTVCVVSLTPFFLLFLTRLFGAEYSISAVVAVGFSFFLLLFFYMQYRISEIQNQMMKLAMQISVADYMKGRKSDRSTEKQSSE